MEKLKVQISNRQKQVKIPSGTRLLLRRCCHAVLAYEKFEKKEDHNLNKKQELKAKDKSSQK